jgi:uncharacterized protein (TIGR03663 family)
VQARQHSQRESALNSSLSLSELREMSERTWAYASLAILLVATFFRLYALELKPMHHDEGVNGFFLTTLLRQGVYKYDPTNYHGPTLYYLTLPSVALLGLSTFAVRLVTALFGIATVGLMLFLRRRIGAIGALAAAALVAVSPGAVFYSRYFIHETLFVFFTVGIVVAALRFRETKEVLYLMLAVASAAMLFATKETAFISVGVLALSTLVAWAYLRVVKGPAVASDAEARSERSYSGPHRDRTSWLIISIGALALFIGINVVLYSSFFTNAQGVYDSVKTYKDWSQTGTSDFHAKEFGTYIKWLIQEEFLAVALAIIGSAAALFVRPRNPFAIFAGAWAFGTLLAYSLIPYKTPWLMLNFTVPMAIAGGYAVQALHRWTVRSQALRALLTVALGFCIALTAYQAWMVSLRQYDNDKYPYVYAHTRRETEQMVHEVERLAVRAGTGKKTGIAIATPDYWPLPWYLRDYTGVAYDQRVLSSYDASKTPIVIGKSENLAQLRETLGTSYRQVGDLFPLRPGVDLVLFARSDLVGK